MGPSILLITKMFPGPIYSDFIRVLESLHYKIYLSALNVLIRVCNLLSLVYSTLGGQKGPLSELLIK